ncbi:MAG: S41 family peptidase [Candidatus Eremiobacterales bacterium]
MNSRRYTAAFAAALLVTALGWAVSANADDVNRAMLDFAFSRAQTQFYKPTSDQALLDGAVSGMRLAVAAKHGDPSKLPALRSRNNQAADTIQLNDELAFASVRFDKTVGEKELSYAAIKGMMESLHDRWTVFMDPKEYRGLNEGLDGGNFPGVGVLIDIDQATQSPQVVQTIDGGPAAKAGVETGDILLAVNGKPTKGLSLDQDSGLLRGKEGTPVDLTVSRKSSTQPLSFHVLRANIHEPSVVGTVIDGDIGYVRVSVFGSTTGQEMSDALSKLDAQGVKGYVLDLRNNGGGYLDAAIDVSSKFIPDGPIVSIDSRTQPLTTFDADATSVAMRPLAVLVNGFTASASEITSGAIQDSGAGVIVGTRTFGKGVVQTIYPMPDGSAVKITTARYLTPKGRDINSIGIAPDILVPDVNPSDLGNPQTDTQLQRAAAYIESKIPPSQS